MDQSSDEEQTLTDETVTATIEPIIDASEIKTTRKRGFKRGRLPGTATSKRADFYISILADTWYDLHRVPAGIIHPAFAWTKEEAQRFGELAYEVCRSRNWLGLLERATEARLVVFILSMEMVKVRQVMDANDQAKKQQTVLPPKPAVIVPQQQTQAAANGGGVERGPVPFKLH